MYTGALIQCGIFHSTPPPVQTGVVNRYLLQYVDEEIRRFFVEALVYKIFRAAQTRGEYKERGQFGRAVKGWILTLFWMKFNPYSPRVPNSVTSRPKRTPE